MNTPWKLIKDSNGELIIIDKNKDQVFLGPCTLDIMIECVNSRDDLIASLKELIEIAGFYIEYMDDANDIVIAADMVKRAQEALSKAGVAQWTS